MFLSVVRFLGGLSLSWLFSIYDFHEMVFVSVHRLIQVCSSALNLYFFPAKSKVQIKLLKPQI